MAQLTIPWKPIPIDSRALPLVEHQLTKGSAVRVPIVDPGYPEMCYWNVANRVAEAGGEIVFGWKLRAYRPIMVQAQHHAVWCSPAGELIDVTPWSQTIEQDHSVFIEDAESAVDFSTPPKVDNIFVPLMHEAQVQEMAVVSRQQMEIMRQQARVAQELGATLLPDGRLVGDPSIAASPRMQALAAEMQTSSNVWGRHAQEMKRLKQKTTKRY